MKIDHPNGVAQFNHGQMLNSEDETLLTVCAVPRVDVSQKIRKAGGGRFAPQQFLC